MNQIKARNGMSARAIVERNRTRGHLCGMRGWEKRIVVHFIAASDESKPGDQQTGTVVYGGWVAPAHVWTDILVPKWVGSVLEAPPPIKYFQMVSLRSRSKEVYGIAPDAADAKVASAIT